jgi:hypothetical protein
LKAPAHLTNIQQWMMGPATLLKETQQALDEVRAE